MSKLAAKRIGGNGLNTESINGILEFISGQTPAVRTRATQQQALTGTDNTVLMTALRTKELIDQEIAAIGGNAASFCLNRNAAPTVNDNAGDNDDAGNAIRAGTLWQYVINAGGSTDADYQWYICEGFATGGNAVWRRTDSIDPAVVDQLVADLADQQTTITSLTTLVNAAYASQFVPSAIATIGTGERLLELSYCPLDNSTEIKPITAAREGLFELLEDLDYIMLGSFVFLETTDSNGDPTGTRSVADGDKYRVNGFKNGFAPQAIQGLDCSSANTIAWTDSGSGNKVEIWKCAAADNENLRASWTQLVDNLAESAESYNHSLANGDKVIVRRKTNTDEFPGVWSDITTVVSA